MAETTLSKVFLAIVIILAVYLGLNAWNTPEEEMVQKTLNEPIMIPGEFDPNEIFVSPNSLDRLTEKDLEALFLDHCTITNLEDGAFRIEATDMAGINSGWKDLRERGYIIEIAILMVQTKSN